jgi:hypothetical protein
MRTKPLFVEFLMVMFRVSEIRSSAALQRYKDCMRAAGRVLPIVDFAERRLQAARHAVW